MHGHLRYSFRPGLYVSAGVGYDYVGENTVNGVDRDNRQENFGSMVSFAYPFDRRSGINFSYIGTRAQEDTGSDTDTLAAGVAISW